MLNDKWIGDVINTSGSYYETECKELMKRHGGNQKLYKFKSRFGEEYYISDVEVIEKIELLLGEYERSTKLIEYLYELVIQKFGVIDFIVRIGHKIAEQRSEGYKEGKTAKQEEMKKVLGL